MGRKSTGIITTGEVIRIDLSYLIKKGYIQKESCVSGAISWTNGSNIGFESYYTAKESYLRLNYTNTNFQTGEKSEHDYKIELVSIPSNLGKGDVLYFVCPETGRYCRILYKCYGSSTWKSREAYQRRIYYQSQIEPKSVRSFKYLLCENQLQDLYKKMVKTHYRGKPTRIMKRIEKLSEKMELAEWNYSRSKYSVL